jgi:hypothetical protein
LLTGEHESVATGPAASPQRINDLRGRCDRELMLPGTVSQLIVRRVTWPTIPAAGVSGSGS